MQSSRYWRVFQFTMTIETSGFDCMSLAYGLDTVVVAFRGDGSAAMMVARRVGCGPSADTSAVACACADWAVGIGEHAALQVGALGSESRTVLADLVLSPEARPVFSLYSEGEQLPGFLVWQQGDD
ncbi:hypothetical protein GCM10022204_25880 [Microlunatus aurantiacus]|uniref:Uncharacterized protein n=1 Tax=Microlunatus aurantiacus TaxID=446786 RepID=A0ABP7DK85_9ACTN